ncbi:hypothetical protein J2S40_004769 [Nocardioides luteus]|uniref:D-amino-acid oxidase n=1 Tax=Nocardioides luteus TaxID=1844 RepID=A0ABQ5T5Q8_9ACTN|nr:FAD-binding oxidoreductase [Nocardioides luteus]MDR7313711.1 hypothetical protein [Nocardioides luteus]GGR63874.1 hypothetical protein GCM10010197_34080 [Nocardioides luteus]GLJ70441.1 hypothetical protein GCM10017579_44770 [Nocardioides luteus]
MSSSAIWRQTPAGVRAGGGIEATRHREDAPDWARSLPGFEPVNANELPNGFRSGYRFSVPLIDMPTTLSYVLERLRVAGGIIVERHVPTLTSLDDAGVIVNCSGVRAAVLADDSDLRSIRGQHVIVANPGLTDAISEDTGASSDLLRIYPQGEVVVLGGTAIDGSSDTTPGPGAAERSSNAASLSNHALQQFPASCSLRPASVFVSACSSPPPSTDSTRSAKQDSTAGADLLYLHVPLVDSSAEQVTAENFLQLARLEPLKPGRR